MEEKSKIKQSRWAKIAAKSGKYSDVRLNLDEQLERYKTEKDTFDGMASNFKFAQICKQKKHYDKLFEDISGKINQIIQFYDNVSKATQNLLDVKDNVEGNIETNLNELEGEQILIDPSE